MGGVRAGCVRASRVVLSVHMSMRGDVHEWERVLRLSGCRVRALLSGVRVVRERVCELVVVCELDGCMDAA